MYGDLTPTFMKQGKVIEAKYDSKIFLLNPQLKRKVIEAKFKSNEATDNNTHSSSHPKRNRNMEPPITKTFKPDITPLSPQPKMLLASVNTPSS